MPFHTPLQLEEYRKDRWFLVSDFVYTTYYAGHPMEIRVPANVFSTDLASIPHILRPLIRPRGTHKAAVIHDWLCYRNPHFKKRGLDGITRSDADKIFFEALIESGVPELKANAMYCAVRLYSFMVKR